MIYLTSDLHFCHNKEFLYAPRGFASIEEHDKELIKRWNETITDEDDVYILGDLMLGDNEHGLECLKQLKGKFHLVWGNHDTDNRKNLYITLPQVVEICGYATMLKYKKYHFYLSHFPTVTSNLEKESLRQCTINLFGHTHQQHKFYQDIPFIYHVGIDTHGKPKLLDEIIEEMIEKVKEYEEVI